MGPYLLDSTDRDDLRFTDTLLHILYSGRLSKGIYLQYESICYLSVNRFNILKHGVI